jgi:hypothetical protein
MNETSSNEGKKGKNMNCPECKGALKEEKTTVTFYDVISIDAVQLVCDKGHYTQTEEESDRISKELKKREMGIFKSYLKRLGAVTLVGTAILLFSVWAVLSTIRFFSLSAAVGHPYLLSLIAGGGVTGAYLVIVLPRVFKTFIAYYWAKQKARERIKNEPPAYDPEDPLGALE